MHALPSGLRTTTPRIDGMRARFPRFHTRRRHSQGVRAPIHLATTAQGVRAPIHPPHQAHRTRSARGRAFHASHRTPPHSCRTPAHRPAAQRPPPPAGGGENQNRPQTRRVCGIAASQTSPVLPPCILMESPPGELAGIARVAGETPIAERAERGRLEAPTSRSAQPAAGGRSRVSLNCVERGRARDRRPPVPHC